MILPTRSQLASQADHADGASGGLSPRKALPQPCSQHVSPIEWDNVILYGQYVLDRARGPLATGPYVVFLQQSGRYPNNPAPVGFLGNGAS